jgi:hypothetical protein
MAPKQWPPNSFRKEIWENQRSDWPHRRIKGNKTPEPGDVVVFFYAPTGGTDPGVYGWAVVERCTKKLYFIPTAPTNHLKMDPWWDDNVKHIVKEIRGPARVGTLFQVDPKLQVTPNLDRKIRHGIKKWLNATP